LRICLLHRYEPHKVIGGVETYVLYLARYFINRGHEVILACPAGSRSLMPIVRWSMLRLFKMDIGEIVDSFQIASDGAKVNADIYHGQCQHSFGFGMLRRIGMTPNQPFVSTAHGATWGVIKSLGSATVHDRLITMTMERSSFNHSDLVICVSNATKLELIEGYKTDLRKLVVIYNGVDPERYMPKTLAKRALYQNCNQLIITFFLRGGARKGTDIGMRILHSLEGNPTRRNCDILIQAVVDTMSSNRLAPIRCDKNLNVYLDPPDSLFATLLSASDIFVFPTLYEGHSFTLLEAMAAGNVVLTSDIPSNKETVQQGVSGYTLDPAHANAWVSRLLDLYVDQANLRAVQENARRRIRERFHSEAMCKKTLELYESVL